MNSKERNEQGLADEIVEMLESDGQGVVDRDAAMTYELGRGLRELPSDDATNVDLDLRAQLEAQFDDERTLVSPAKSTRAVTRFLSPAVKLTATVAASVLFLGALAGMFLPSVQKVREAARRPMTVESKIASRDSPALLTQDRWGMPLASNSQQAPGTASIAPNEKLPSGYYADDDAQYGTNIYAFDEGGRAQPSKDQVLDDLSALGGEAKVDALSWLAIGEHNEIRQAREDLKYTKDLLTRANNRVVELDPAMRIDGTRNAVSSQSENDQVLGSLKEVRNQFEDRYVKQQERLKDLLSKIAAPVIIGGQTVHHVKIAELGKKIEKAKSDLAEAANDRDRIAVALQNDEEKELLWILKSEGKIGDVGKEDVDPLKEAIETRLQDLEIARIELVERYGPKHPRVKSVDRQVVHFEEQLEESEEGKRGLEIEGLSSEEELKLYRDALQKKIVENQEFIRTGMEEYAIHDAAAEKILKEERQIEEARERLMLLKERLRAEVGISNAEQYEPIVENPFVAATGGDAISTFAIDVDTASYANTRRFINNGALPPPNAVRLEELINYFKYDYQQPKGDEPFSMNLELASCPWNDGHQLLRVGLQGKDVHVAERPPTNVVFLIDVSGSMQDSDKLPLLKRGFQMMVDQLNEDDSVSIVTYAGNAGVALEPTSGDQKKVIKEAIEKLTPGGSTHGSAGIKLAYQLAQQNFIAKGSNKVILATDGDLNIGVTDDNQLVDLIKGKAAEGVFLTVLGSGTGNLKDGKLEKLADNGNGVYSYIDSLREAHKVLVEQLSGSLLTIAKDVKIQIEFNPAEVSSYRLLGYENRALKTEDFDNDQKDAGEIGAGHSVTALYEIVPAKSKKAQRSAAPVGMKYQIRGSGTAMDAATLWATLSKAAKSGELATVAVRYKRADENTSQRLEFTIANEERSFPAASEDFRFAASVAGFGMLLRGSAYAGTATFHTIEDVASGAMGNDASGYRSEFVDIVRKAAGLAERQ